MDRKQFLKALGASGLCCVAAWARTLPGRAGEPAGDADWIEDLERRLVRGAETPGAVKADKAADWIKSLMDHMDAALDPEARGQLLRACGRSCYDRAFGVAGDRRPSAEEAARYLRALEEGGYALERDGDAVSFTFSWGRDHQNPWGLTMRDGYCMCPLVESGPPGLSPTFCQCSTGYVAELFRRRTGGPVEVELLESLKTGGSDCVFRVTLHGV
ncbi:MAG: hypothetical protein JW819_08580 [Candidatus Krumholzibacteriota bacterium]|nr:hypothetical protein [Candidatus Krumholzibacteriota bacterium]